MKEFFKRGFVSAWGGPFILAIIYYIIGVTGEIKNISLGEVSLGIITMTIMAFIAGGITVIYKSEKLPTAFSALIHAGVLYLDYLFMYLVNSWIPKNFEAIGIFTAIFAVGFAFVWLIIYLCIKNKTDGINKMRLEKN